MNAKEILLKARKLIELPENWTRNRSARNKDGIGVEHDHPDACKFCMLGAIWSVAGYNSDAEEILRKQTPVGSISTFNDDSAHEMVLKAFDDAIASCE